MRRLSAQDAHELAARYHRIGSDAMNALEHALYVIENAARSGLARVRVCVGAPARAVANELLELGYGIETETDTSFTARWRDGGPPRC